MSNFSNYLEEKLLGHTLLRSAFTFPPTIYLSLATTIASDGDFFTEVPSGLGYTRQLMNGNFTEPTSSNDWTVLNSNDITYSAATTPWGILNHFAYFDDEAIGGGNMLYFGDLGSARDVQTNDVFEFQAGFLSVRLD